MSIALPYKSDATRSLTRQVSLLESDAVKSIKGAAQLRASDTSSLLFFFFFSVDVKLHHISIHSMKHLTFL